MKDITLKKPAISSFQLTIITLLRIVIGWHLLYEGVVKFISPGWTAASFLESSWGIAAPFYQFLASSNTLVSIVNFLNIWGLILLGTTLILGLFLRSTCLLGMILLGLYYMAHPPFLENPSSIASEGNYLFVNKNIIEIMGLFVVYLFPTGHFIGLDRILSKLHFLQVRKPAPDRKPYSRRDLLFGLASTPVLGGFISSALLKHSLKSREEGLLANQVKPSIDGLSSATTKAFTFTKPDALIQKPAKGIIKNLQLSRIILGGNLIGGWAHSRDLIYVSKLVKAYHHENKIFETLSLAEASGVDTLLTNPQLSEVIQKYWKHAGGKIQFISDCGVRGDCLKGLNKSIDAGAHAVYIQGEIADRLVLRNKFDEIERFLLQARKQGLPAGIGAHHLKTVQACVEHGLRPDFWVKTLHNTNYWSATEKMEHDNIWCVNPSKTIQYMESLKEPWIAFKILAAGAIHPKEGVPYAFKNGADFICMGMYDFQIVDDVNITVDALSHLKDRRRPWYG
ncbi:MAG: hypothetical protein HQL32_15385 [Planctomycetes bacterium]|nr:hypothetical protein [Planctomycetota bacterium]